MISLPEKWEVAHLKECVVGKGEYGANASAVEYDQSLPRYVRITDITKDGRLSENKKVSITEENAKNYYLQDGDFLFARTGATTGKTFRYVQNAEQLAFAGYLIKFHINTNVLLPAFLSAITQSNHYWYWVNRTLRAGAQPNINAKEFASYKFSLPPVDIQAEICRILACWDNTINLTEQLIIEKQQCRKGLMQQLLTGKRRLPGFHVPLNTLNFLDIVSPTQRSVPKPTQAYDILGIRSHFKGTFPKRVEDPNKVGMDVLYKVKAGDLIVNITFAWEGAIAIVPPEHDGRLVSHRFPTYRPQKKLVSTKYLRYLIIQDRFKYLLAGISPGGAGRNRVLNKKDFLNLEVSLPDLDEQKEIANVLDVASREVELLQAKTDALREQKKGLMQQLLTGKKRVKVAT